jgi:ATP:ADP antiporter, AAA family
LLGKIDMTIQGETPIARAFKTIAKVEPHEAKATIVAFLYAFLIFAAYNALKPLRDAMGTVYGVKNLQELFTGTFFAMLVASPIYGAFASRMNLSAFLPWVYGFLVINVVIFYVLFETVGQARWLAAAFYIWISVLSLFITSVFWSFMADLFSRTQAKRLFGFITTGFSVGGLVGPLLSASLVGVIGTNNLLVLPAVAFTIVIFLVRILEKEKAKVAQLEPKAATTTLGHKLGGNPFAGFGLLFRSPYLLMIAVFLLMMTWVSTVIYFQQAELVANAFSSVAERTRVFALIETAVNSGAIIISLFGTSRITQRFGITTTLIINPLFMVVGFCALAVSPVLGVLLVVQVVRRIAEYALARPGREMLFTVVDQESKYKAKNVIDTVVYRGGDLTSAWITAGFGMVGFGIPGTALFGAAVCAVWGAIAVRLGRKYEGVNKAQTAATSAAAAPAQ